MTWKQVALIKLKVGFRLAHERAEGRRAEGRVEGDAGGLVDLDSQPSQIREL